jgi:DNA polymerase-1
MGPWGLAVRQYTHMVADDEVTINVPTSRDESHLFTDFLRREQGKITAFDTETTGLRIYSADFGIRLAQFGNEHEAWVLRHDLFRDLIRDTLAERSKKWVAHNAPFDLLVADQTGLAPLADLGPNVFDTYILAHLLDPRLKHEGGTGLSLKPLSEVYVDPEAADTQEGLASVFLSLYRAWSKTADPADVERWKERNPKRPHMAYGFTNVDIDHDLYLTYAGLDVIYAKRLFNELAATVKATGLGPIAHWEHRVQLLTARQKKRGLRIDVDYTQELATRLADESTTYATKAATYGVANVNAPAQVAAGLTGMGEVWKEKTGSGAPSTAAEVLLPLADLDRDWQRIEARDPNPLADAVLRSKRAAKWGTTYAQAFLDGRDAADRIHPDIKSLAARTARMSVSGPPLQQLPSSDWMIRRAIIADEGRALWSVDYSQVEMRVLAALSGDAALKAAIASGEDLHTFTAKLVFARPWSTMTDAQKAKARKLCKAVGFGKVYGGGATTIARQTGAPIADVKVAIAEYDRAFPGIKAYGRKLQRNAQYGGMEVVTPFGRHLPLDRDRAYAATNYVVQSTARDLLAKSLIDLDDAGLSEYLLLPIHDENLGDAPTEDAADVAHAVKLVMESTFHGVHIAADADVLGDNWGMGYGGPSRLALPA